MKNQHSSQRQIYKIDESWGRGYSVNAIFTAHPEDMKRLKGHSVYFGEICGKHSEVSLDINDETCTKLESSPEIVNWIEQNLGSNVRDSWYRVDSFTISGHNPFSYFELE